MTFAFADPGVETPRLPSKPAFGLLDTPASSSPVVTPEPDPTDQHERASARPKRRFSPGKLAGHVILLALAVFSILPVYWMFAAALRAPGDVLDQSIIPWPISFETFADAWTRIGLGEMLLNTILLSAGIAAGQMLVALLAGYGFAMWRFPGRNVILMLFIGSWLIPFQVTMIPNYVLISDLGLLGTLWGVILPNLGAAFAVLLMRQHMESFPREIIDAAKVDGRSSWNTLWTVVVPNVTPAIAATTIMLFISAWNEYLWPALVLRTGAPVLQVGIRQFLSSEGNDWGALMAASAIAALPILLLYLFLQRYIVDAFVRSGLK
ncbi:carbohydrate ABC transporter permease [Demequina flava]|uniref:carbohydrate ABC transporter permease n=1 Tax=Demequina flava TaxID=1095025 RepID=UPI000B1823E5|nr:carbohydrate ABC transporter permease [Demequina flava]